MSIQLMEDEVRRLLSTPEPEVVCISGHWGVGKTFAWNRLLREAKKKAGGIALKSYAYVSLFGINSLNDFKYAIFENTVGSKDIGVEPSLESLAENAKATIGRVTRKSAGFIQQLPGVKKWVDGLGPIWFLSVTETIVCVDDIERRGKSLAVRDVMGLVSNLKEQKHCKVVLILNDDALEDDEKEDFSLYKEKVVDTYLKFAPSAEECTAIALRTASEADKMLAADIVKLGISNIRLIKKIERCVRRIEPLLKDYDPAVLNQAVHSLVLLGWSVYEPDQAPSLAYLQDRKSRLFVFGPGKNEAVSEEETAWNAILEDYRFIYLDDFDGVLLDGIRDGYFDSNAVRKQAAKLHENAVANNSAGAFTRAWALYHDSFNDNQDEVLDAIFRSFLDNVNYIGPENMNSTVKFLKEFGRHEQAASVITHYVESRKDTPRLFDLSENTFMGDFDDPDVIRAFKEAYESVAPKPNPVLILLDLAKSHGWNPKDIDILASTSEDIYYEIFKTHTGSDLRGMIAACLQFGKIRNADAPMKEVVRRATAALRRIGNESHMNAMRVRKFGVSMEASDPTAPLADH